MVYTYFNPFLCIHIYFSLTTLNIYNINNLKYRNFVCYTAVDVLKIRVLSNQNTIGCL